MIRVYNTLSKTKETFEPITPGKVGIYLCGPTVYKPSHVGHMVGPVIFDTIKRYLTYSGYDVTFVINVTDVDDKLIAESKKREMTMADLASEMTEDYQKNLAAMGVDSIDHFPLATENMDEIIALTQTLIDKGFAYESQGDVYFDVTKCADYGKLSGRKVEAMQGDGGGSASLKRGSADFALWKSAKRGEPSWESPWGKGRPGWHIECSAMSRRILGKSFDIHGGGLDLAFPHHENEIAQSESAHGQPMAKYWMHNGLMQASDEVGKLGGRKTKSDDQADLASQEMGKISKSKGSSPFSELLEQFPGETIRFFLLSTHYRRPIDYSTRRIEEVGTGLETFYRFFKRFERITGESFYEVPFSLLQTDGDLLTADDPLLEEVAKHRKAFLDAMDDDFNTGGGTGELFDLVRCLNKHVDNQKLEESTDGKKNEIGVLKKAASVLRELAGSLGLFLKPLEAPGAGTGGGDDQLVSDLVELLITIRAESRKNKDFAMSDLIRDKLTEIGITLEDRPGGTEWSR
jgi:cysteinyl-tRNA synthetase